MSESHHRASAISAFVRTTFLVAAIATVIAVRLSSDPSLPGIDPVNVAAMAPDQLAALAADQLDAATAAAGPGYAFEVVQRSTLHAKPDGPKIELRSPDDPRTVTGLVDEFQVGTVLSRGGVTAEAFWMEMAIARGDEADFSAAELFARVLERDGKLWRDDGRGWYLTDESPGVGMDPVTARALAGALRSLIEIKAAEPESFEGRTLAGVTGSSTPEAYPGVIAADGAGFTEKTFGIECRFDDQGRLVRLEASARNLNQDTYDLIVTTVVTISYGSPGDPPDPTPTMAPEPLPTDDLPEVAE